MNVDIKKDIDIVVIGRIGIDTNTYLPNHDIDFKVEANFTENIDYLGGISSYYLEKYNIQNSILQAQICARYTCSLERTY